MADASVEIYSKVNELFTKTKVTQKLKNESENPVELKIYVYKNRNCIFSSFSAKIGDSIEVKSKVIKKKKAEEKYTDSISSGNAAIFVSNDPTNSQRIIINMGNIPPRQEVLFISEFLQFVESSDLYEFEIFRNLPIFSGKDNKVIQNSDIRGSIEINTTKKINKIDKSILSDKLNIIEEKYIDENKCQYSIKYEYKNLSSLLLNAPDRYIPSNKIYFEIENETKGPISFYQKSSKQNEASYIVQYKNYPKNDKDSSDDILSPALFIFLLDQSGSMSGHPMEVASKALILFLQSLPAGSYYQIIGFGSNYVKYDKIPKGYTQRNIKDSIAFIEKLKADKGGTNIYDPLKDIYNSKADYKYIKLPKNIFLLTDGEIDDKKKTLSIIEENSDEFFVYSIGIGSYFDKDLIKNAGILGKGNYEFCSDIKELNEIIVKEIKNSTNPFYSDFEFSSNLDDKNLYQLKEKISILKENQMINIKYITQDKKEKDEIETDKKIKLNLKYKVYDKKTQKNEEINETYEIDPFQIELGEELSKLIINAYLMQKKDSLSEEEKTQLALKYQIFSDYTSLFAEVELSEKLTEEMKKKIIGDEENNVIKKQREVNYHDYDSGFSKKKYLDLDLCYSANPYDDYNCCGACPGEDYGDDDYDNCKSVLKSIHHNVYGAYQNLKMMNVELTSQGASISNISESYIQSAAPKKTSGVSNFFKNIGLSIKGLFSKKSSNSDNKKIILDKKEEEDKTNKVDNEIKNEIKEEDKNEIKINENNDKKECKDNNENEEKNNNKEINVKEIVNDQNFVEGYWEISEKTKKIKEKYENEFKLLKELKDKNINDNIAITILIIYFINKEHSELLNELFLIIQKAKNYIKKNTNDSYENIIKEIGF